MSEKEVIEQVLQSEQRIPQRQQLLKGLWKLNQGEELGQSLVEMIRQQKRSASEPTEKHQHDCGQQ